MVYTPFVQMEYVIKEYKLKWRPLEPTRKYQLPQNLILKLILHPIIES